MRKRPAKNKGPKVMRPRSCAITFSVNHLIIGCFAFWFPASATASRDSGQSQELPTAPSLSNGGLDLSPFPHFRPSMSSVLLSCNDRAEWSQHQSDCQWLSKL